MNCQNCLGGNNEKHLRYSAVEISGVLGSRGPQICCGAPKTLPYTIPVLHIKTGRKLHPSQLLPTASLVRVIANTEPVQDRSAVTLCVCSV